MLLSPWRGLGGLFEGLSRAPRAEILHGSMFHVISRQTAQGFTAARLAAERCSSCLRKCCDVAACAKIEVEDGNQSNFWMESRVPSDSPITIHPTAQVSALADLEPSQRGTRLVVGAECRIDSFVKVKPVGGRGDVVIGERCYLNSGCVLYSGNGISIGNDVLIAANCTLAPVNHAFRERDRLICEQGFDPSRGGIVIEDDVWIGANCVLLDGAVLRRGCVVAAGSLVRSELPAYSICRGIPATAVDQRC